MKPRFSHPPIDELKRTYQNRDGSWRWADMPIEIYKIIDGIDIMSATVSIGAGEPTQYGGFSLDRSSTKIDYDQKEITYDTRHRIYQSLTPGGPAKAYPMRDKYNRAQRKKLAIDK